MRDINRIDPLLAKLGEAWKQTPDQRFGQFMYNFFMHYGKDPFYPEDDEWMVGIQAYIDGENIAKAMDTYRDSKTEHYHFDIEDMIKSVQKSLRESAEKHEHSLEE